MAPHVPREGSWGKTSTAMVPRASPASASSLPFPKPVVAFSGRIVCLRYFSLDPSNQTTFSRGLIPGKGDLEKDAQRLGPLHRRKRNRALTPCFAKVRYRNPSRAGALGGAGSGWGCPARPDLTSSEKLADKCTRQGARMNFCSLCSHHPPGICDTSPIRLAQAWRLESCWPTSHSARCTRRRRGDR